MSDELREALAAVSHSIWAHWMNYLFSKCEQNPDGSVTIPTGLVLRWSKQADTPYLELSEQERESDRDQADKILALLPAVGAGVPVEVVDVALKNMQLAAELNNYRTTLDDLAAQVKTLIEERDFWKNFGLNAKDELLRTRNAQEDSHE